MEVLKRKRFGLHGLIYHLARLCQVCLSWDTCFDGYHGILSIFAVNGKYQPSQPGKRYIIVTCTIRHRPWNIYVVFCFMSNLWNWNDPVPWDDEMAPILRQHGTQLRRSKPQMLARYLSRLRPGRFPGSCRNPILWMNESCCSEKYQRLLLDNGVCIQGMFNLAMKKIPVNISWNQFDVFFPATE